MENYKVKISCSNCDSYGLISIPKKEIANNWLIDIPCSKCGCPKYQTDFTITDEQINKLKEEQCKQ